MHCILKHQVAPGQWSDSIVEVNNKTHAWHFLIFKNGMKAWVNVYGVAIANTKKFNRREHSK